jgi:hypothetical protein
MKHYTRLRLTGKIHTKRIMGDDEARFWSKVNRGRDADCWLWTGSTDGNGYGIFSSEGRTWRAHRWAYEHFVGPLPEGTEHIEHACHSRTQSCQGGVCGHRRCVNYLQGDPDALHLEAVTKLVNTQRAHRSPHSRELIAELYSRWAAGETTQALGAEAGINPGALYARFLTLERTPGFEGDRPNRRPRRLTPELVKALHDRYLAGDGVRALADEIGMDPTAIYYQFRTLKDVPYEPWSQGKAPRAPVMTLLVTDSAPRPLIAVTGQPQELPGLFDAAS